jgi:thymidylate kinase
MVARGRGPRRGRYVVVAGPDGTGKTTVADALITGVLGDAATLHLHHRPRVLGGRTPQDGEPVTEPHAESPYPGWASALKVCYLFTDHVLGWLLRMRPALARGEHVLMERGWWDLVVDPRRYRLRGGRLALALGRLLPRPDATVVLTGSAEVIGPRTGELPEAELARQLAAWRTLPPTAVRPVPVDATKPLDEVVAAASDAVTGTDSGAKSDADTDPRCRTGGEQTWIALPRATAPRWWLPRDPPRASANGLLMYSPVTPRGVLAWSSARQAARLGALRALPSAAGPPAEVVERIAGLVPHGGRCAVGRATHPGRFSVLILDAHGRPARFVKVAHDEEGVAALRREAAGTEQLGARCQAPLRAPRVVESQDGLLVLEAAFWQPRLRPWLLPVEVARALGSLQGSGDAGGPAHGDVAPWNLLKGRHGTWWLIDWAQTKDAAPPFHDVLHHLVQSCAFLGRPSPGDVLAGLEGRGPLTPVLDAFAAGAGLPRSASREDLLRYLDGVDSDVDLTRPEERRAARVRQQLHDALEGGPR